MIPHRPRRVGGALLLVCLVAGVSLPARGQEAVMDLMQIPLAGHLTVGSETPGYLTSGLLWTDDSYVQAWGLEVAARQAVTVDLLSDEFDAFLMVTGPGLAEILSDDDGAGACDSRITFTAPESAVYRVVVNTLSSGATGRFRIRVTDEPGPVTAGDCNIQAVELAEWLMALPTGDWELSLGQEVPGELSRFDEESPDGSYAQAWALRMQVGQEATVDLLSDEFDAFLYVIGPGLDEPLSDDDGAGACDARVTFTAPQSGKYRVVVNSLWSEATGRFRLRAMDRPGPVPAAECNMIKNPDLDDEQLAWLMALPTAGRTVAVGDEVRGELTFSDSVSWDDTYIQAWDLPMQGGEEATVDLLSDDFDAYLMILGPGLPLRSNDRGAGACDARITFTAPETGAYRVLVKTILGESTGQFRLRATEQPGPTTAGECETLDDVMDLDEEQLAWLMALPAAGRTVAVGDEVRGELTFADSVSWDDTYIQAWDLPMQGGQEATVDLLSDDFDAYLMILGPGLPLRSNDDGAGACDARITFAAPETGAYRVLVNTILGESTGQFRLRATDQPGPMTAGECETLGDIDELLDEFAAELSEVAGIVVTLPATGQLRVGAEVTGEITVSDPVSGDETYLQVWELPLQAGERATVDLLSSDFDAFLYLVGPGIEGAAFDDDSAGACDARLTFTASESGTFRVAVNTVLSGSVGSYRLRVTEEPGPMTRGECSML